MFVSGFALELGDAFGLTCHGYPALKWQTNVTFHTLENGVVTAPTCTERGYTTYVCPTCGETVYTQYTDALGHTEDVDRTVVYQMYRECVCAVCGETYRIWNDVRLSYIDFQYHKEGILNAAWSDEGDDPWSYQEKTQRLESANAGKANSVSTTKLTVTLQWPAAVSFQYGVSSEKDCDLLKITMETNGQTETIADGISGEEQGAFARELEAGVYVFTFSYEKDPGVDDGRDVGWISDPCIPLRCTTMFRSPSPL